jgi:hypothetical protein
MDGAAVMVEEVKKPDAPRIAIESVASPTSSRWLSDQLKDAMKTFKGLPKTPEIDRSPNRGANWMGRK